MIETQHGAGFSCDSTWVCNSLSVRWKVKWWREVSLHSICLSLHQGGGGGRREALTANNPDKSEAARQKRTCKSGSQAGSQPRLARPARWCRAVPGSAGQCREGRAATRPGGPDWAKKRSVWARSDWVWLGRTGQTLSVSHCFSAHNLPFLPPDIPTPRYLSLLSLSASYICWQVRGLECSLSGLQSRAGLHGAPRGCLTCWPCLPVRAAVKIRGRNYKKLERKTCKEGVSYF